MNNSRHAPFTRVAPVTTQHSPVVVTQERTHQPAFGMAPNKPRKKNADGDAGDGDNIVIRVMEAVADERVILLLQKALYPQALIEQFTVMNNRIDALTTQLTAKDSKIAALEKRVDELEESADRAEQYVCRSNMLFSGFKETGGKENTDDTVIELVNDTMKLSPPLQAHDIARSHRLGAPREGGRPRPIIVRFSSDKARDAVYRARSGLKTYNSQNREAPVYANDDLTARRAKLAFECRKLKKDKKIADTWTYNGKVVIKDLTGKITEVGGPAVLLKM